MSNPPNRKAHKIIKALMWLFLPVLMIVTVIVSFALVNTILQVGTPQGPEAGSLQQAILTILNFALFFMGLISIALGLAGLVMAIITLVRPELPEGQYDKRSGEFNNSVVPPEIQKWSWGGAGIPLIWGLSHGVWISLLCLVPIANIVVFVVLGLKGNELAWKKNRWASVERFLKVQRIWGIVGIVIIALSIGFSILTAFWSASAPNQATGVILQQYSDEDLQNLIDQDPNLTPKQKRQAKKKLLELKESQEASY